MCSILQQRNIKNTDDEISFQICSYFNISTNYDSPGCGFKTSHVVDYPVMRKITNITTRNFRGSRLLTRCERQICINTSKKLSENPEKKSFNNGRVE